MWYYAQNGKTFGPAPLEKLKELARAGTLKPTDHVVPVGAQEWKPASTVEELFPRLPPRPEAVTATPPATPPAMGPDSWSLDTREPAVRAVPPPLQPGLWQKIVRHCRRLFTWNLQNVRPDADEMRFLQTQNVADPTLQRYLVWRHSILLILLFPVFLLALLNTIDRLTSDISDLNGLGKTTLVASILFPFSLPFAGVLALIVWYRPKLSWRLLLTGWVIATVGPLLLDIIPYSSQHDHPPELMALGHGALVFGRMILLQIPIFALTAAYGTQRACLRLKTLLPQSSVPGLFLAVTAPVISLVLWPFFVLTSQLASNPLLFMGVFGLVASPMVYAFSFKRMIMPFTEPRDFARLRVLQIVSTVVFWVGVLALVSYGFGVAFRLPDPEDPTGRRIIARTLIGFTSDGSFFHPWDWRLIRWTIVELLGRSLFTMVLVTDLFMRVNSYIWLASRKVLGSEAGGSYDQLMERLQTSGRWEEESVRPSEPEA
ncbi:MAG: DUF4339 domain-containing protein [Gemmataceae bacterium]